VTLRKLLAWQILKLEGGTSLQPMWGPQGFNAQDPTLMVRKGRCAHSIEHKNLLMYDSAMDAFVGGCTCRPLPVVSLTQGLYVMR
jgi:hypothetical protein